MSLHCFKGRALQTRRTSSRAFLVLTILAIEFLDEYFDGARMVALPLLQTQLHLTYTQIGLLSTIPNLVSSLIEPVLGIWGDLGQRKRLILGGGITFALAVLLVAISQHWWMLLLGFSLFHPASGAFVSLSQATLMDSDPARHEQNMARWGVAGSLGVFAGTLSVSAVVALGWSWRSVFGAIVLLALLLTGLLRSAPFPKLNFSSPGLCTEDSCSQEVSKPTHFWQGLRAALQLLQRGDVLRWLILLDLADLMLDIFMSLLPLYLVSIAQMNEAEAGLVVTLCIALGLVGDFLLIPLLERIRGLKYLRLSALLVLFLFPTFLLVPNLGVKLVLLVPLSLCRTGWYPVLMGQLYSALPGQSSSVMTLGMIVGQFATLIPVGLGWVSDRYGLDITLWFLLLAPISLLIGARTGNGLKGMGNEE